jgi:hypothetical protein
MDKTNLIIGSSSITRIRRGVLFVFISFSLDEKLNKNSQKIRFLKSIK